MKRLLAVLMSLLLVLFLFACKDGETDAEESSTQGTGEGNSTVDSISWEDIFGGYDWPEGGGELPFDPVN